MFKRNTNYSEWLVPYLEGGLDEAQSAEMKARLAADPALAGEADRLRRTLGHLRQSAERRPKAANADVPADLWPRLRARLEPPPAPRRVTSGWMAGAGAVAALAWAALWIPTLHLPDRAADHSQNRPSRQIRVTTNPPQKRVVSAPRPAGIAKPVPAPSAPAVPVPSAHFAAPAGKQATGVAGPKAPAPTLAAGDPFTLPVPPPHPKDAGHLSTPPFPLSGKSLTPLPSGKPTQMASGGAAYYDSAGMAARKPQGDAPATPVMTVPAPPPAAPAPAPLAATTPPAPVSDAPITGSLFRSRSGARPAPAPPRRAEPDGLRQRHAAKQRGAGTAAGGSAMRFDTDESASLDAWQAALAQSAQPPLLGDTVGEQQANQALMAARESGTLETLRARLEAKRSQAPTDIVAARMLAAVYDFGFQGELALRERRRLTGLDGAVGEDWFALGQAEEHAGNREAARAAYRHALESPTPPAAFHAALARQRSS